MTTVSNAPDLLQDLIARARRAGADEADALLVESHGQSARCRLRQLETIERAESSDLGLRVIVGRRQAIVSTGDLSPASLARLVENGITIAKAVPEDRYVGLAEPGQIADAPPALDLDDGQEPDGERLAAQALEAEEAALEQPQITNSEGAEASWSRARSTLAASNGFTGQSARSLHSLSATVIASSNGQMERDYDYATVIRAAALPSPASIGLRAAERAVRRLNPRKVKSQAVPVVLDPRVASSIVRHLATAISGPAVARGTTFLQDRLGKPVFAKGITIIDDPLRADGLRSRSFDGEGLATRRRALIEDGVLTTWLLDCGTARQLGLASTGHAVRGVSAPPSPAPSNIYLAPGAVSRAALLGEIKRGFYVTDLMGMAVSYTTGDYSRGAAGLWIEDGALAGAVSEVTIAGSLPDMFMQLTAADDLEFRHGVDAPTLRVDGLTVAGQ